MAAVFQIFALVTAPHILSVVKPFTAEGKVQALRRLVEEALCAHGEAVINLKSLEPIPDDYASKSEMIDLDKRDMLLNRLSSRLREIELEVSSGVALRWSPVFLDGDIAILSGELQTIYQNTMNTTRTVNELIKKAGENPTPEGQNNQQPVPPSSTPVPLVITSAGRV